MTWRSLMRFSLAAACLLLSTVGLAADRAIFQVSEADEAKWNLVLNNVRNLQAGAEPDAVVEIVAYGPGVRMLTSDSPVAARIAEALQAKVQVVACRNTMANAQLTEADMLPNIGYVPAGVVEVMRREQQGYAYIRP